MAQSENQVKIGLALGGGGVRGFAHIPILEALDEMGIRPSMIAANSMGAIIGAMYACGLSGREIRERITRHFVLKNDGLWDVISKRSYLLKWINAFSVDILQGGLVNIQKFLRYLLDEIKDTTFESLEIPLLVNAADFWTAEEVVFEKGDILPAIQASIAVPGVFSPVSINGRVLVDGGVVNVLPYEHLIGRVDFIVAVDVNRDRMSGNEEVPNVLDATLGTFDLMMAANLAEKMKHHKPDFYLHPDNHGVRLFDFLKVADVLAYGEKAAKILKKELSARIAQKI